MIVNRALIREVLYTSGAVTVVIVSIFLVVRMLGFLKEAAQGSIPVESVLILLILKLISYLDVVIPLMLYIAILMVLGRWNRDNEMTVLAACGIGLSNFLKPLAVLAALTAGLVATFSFYLGPLAVRAGHSIEQEFKQRSEISGVVPGVFMETRSGGGVYFVERYDRDAGRYENVFVYKSSFKKEGVVVAKYGFQRIDELTGDPFLILRNGTRYEGNPGEPNYRVLDFETYALRIEQRNQISTILPVKGRSIGALMRSDHPQLVGEWHWRIAKVMVVPILALFALVFSHVNPREGRLLGMVLAFLAYFLYSNMLGFGVALMKKGELEGGWGLLAIHAMFLVLAVYFFMRRSRNLSFLPTLGFRFHAP
ncbi:MAG: LPS export ABC transporter permease LptF [Gammaproteobacteria bacterium]|nr:LPS export ABC transporter permease LptF [Gammaproteobacteria bacterium]